MTSPEGFSIRRTRKEDYEGVLSTLKSLTTVGTISRSHFESIVSYWDSIRLLNARKQEGGELGYKYNNFVIVDDHNGQVAATGNIIIEQKLIHECGLVGHIEDISVSEKYQGKKLGKFLIDKLTSVGFANGCYKIILDCDRKNVKFYEKCGYEEAGVEMRIRSNL
ncbi:hypothetical protein TPHA_0D00540 [Tetrapisispora phaffii CBS 4417]|uniref:Glucosamine 6-phosphate N-acetyltransferase n=1 Tax=Tetrapisispora phaffii (strain ATCC 24235 / CBS 4417 / NBRC 1672 / NRRL Y-8282 / UCD 70-5) TaxID=1071381 RepID=G8BS77_TETPH|nr:hypothetical protein TPHA_0D00540 [Tetrapisispora phaffii CBS 4417]CCE62698.1 hypothetical protein TPHA_0D00540 [Tetrapisispora phaffii CBS 4417]